MWKNEQKNWGPIAYYKSNFEKYLFNSRIFTDLTHFISLIDMGTWKSYTSLLHKSDLNPFVVFPAIWVFK